MKIQQTYKCCRWSIRSSTPPRTLLPGLKERFSASSFWRHRGTTLQSWQELLDKPGDAHLADSNTRLVEQTYSVFVDGVAGMSAQPAGDGSGRPRPGSRIGY